MSNSIVLDAETEAQWAEVRSALKAEVGDAAFNSWLKPVVLAALREGQAVMTVPTRFMRDWVVSHYGDRLRELWAAANPGIHSVDIHVKTVQQRRSANAQSVVTEEAREPVVAASEEAAPASAAPRSRVEDYENRAEVFDVGASLDPRFTFENFVVGKPNELAYAARGRFPCCAV